MRNSFKIQLKSVSIIIAGSGSLGTETFNYLKTKYEDIFIVDLKKPSESHICNFFECDVNNEDKLYNTFNKIASHHSDFIYLVNFCWLNT